MPINASKLPATTELGTKNNSAISSRGGGGGNLLFQNKTNDDSQLPSSNNFYKLYKVVLNRTELETWDNDDNKDSTESSLYDKNLVTVFYNKPEGTDIPAQKNQLKPLAICHPDSWSNNQDPEIASSLVQTMGSIIDKIEHDFKGGNFLSIVGKTPSIKSSHNETSFDLKESEEESLKSFEMNEILNDISDDSINNENLNSSNCDSLKEFKNMEKIVSDSGYMTVHPSTNSRLGTSSNDDEESTKHVSSDKNNCVKNFEIPKIIIEQDLDTKKSSQQHRSVIADEDLTKVTSMVDSYGSDESCESFSHEDNPADESIVKTQEIQSILNDLVARCDDNASNHGNKNFQKKPLEIINSENKLPETNKIISNTCDPNSNIHEHRSKLRRRRSMLNSTSPHSKSIRHDSDSSSNFDNDEIKPIRSLSKKNSLSPLKKKSKKSKQQNSYEQAENLKTESISASPRFIFDDELNTYNENDEEDEFFLAITTDRLETGSCPNIYWYSEAGK